VTFKDGTFTVEDIPESQMTFAEVAGQAYSAVNLPPDTEPGLEAVSFFDPENFTWPFGCHICVVEVSPGTGETRVLRYVAVDDIGNVINPMIVDGMLHGGIAQGIGQAMQERAVTIAGTRHPLDPLFSVIATRNPIEMEGTYPLPEAQRDRFLLEVPLPDPGSDVLARIAAVTTREHDPEVTPLLDPKQFAQMQRTVRRVIVADSVIERAARWVGATRPGDPAAPAEVREGVRLGAGARALQALILCGKVEALRAGRTHMADEDWRRWRHEGIRHRLVLSLEGELSGIGPEEIVSAVDRAVAHLG
jgi:CO/xanthine dehydrogenase Mo-binding subunit